MATGPGSAGNVIAAICSLFIPGLGQLVQGRVLPAIFWFIFWCLATGFLFIVTVGTLVWLAGIVNIMACVDSAIWKGPKSG